jgi:hypothetical protein
VPITPRLSLLTVPKTFRPEGVPAYVAFLSNASFASDHHSESPKRVTERRFVGSYDDILVPTENRPPRQTVRTPGSVRIGEGRVWHEGCVQFIWIEGTSPHLAGPAVSNPVTRSVEEAAGVINDIWKQCCVRFKFTLKVVALAELGDLAGAVDGIYLDHGRVTIASRTAINAVNFAEAVRRLRDDPACAAFLVVDEVRNGAGYAELGGKIGVVTIKGPNLPPEDLEDADRSGTTSAHELGHALGGIKHVDGEGDQAVRHAHGELMWGEGCEGHPNPQQRRYENLNAADCEKMRAATTPTTVICAEAEPV